MGKLFGTDGVRGLANVDISPLLALKLGTTAARVIASAAGARPRVVVGRDSRISGDILESALIAGICSTGADALIAGIIPSPGVAYLTTSTRSAAGAVISASHNPVQDNGIKFFGPDGYKLDDALELAIEEQLEEFDSVPRPSGASVGNVLRRHELAWEYAEHVKSSVEGLSLSGMRLVIDCANGAASELAPRVFEELGAAVTAMACSPDGRNINDSCGSLHPKGMCDAVRSNGADAGLSLDGDADRVIMADETGAVVDGDRIMAILGLHAASTVGLSANAVVGTVMSNVGLELALRREGVALVRTAVGDRYVCDEMRRTGAEVGGEKSGHVILSRYATTGDGMITALQVLSVMLDTGKRLSELAAQMEEFPQVLLNVPVAQRGGWDSHEPILQAIAEAERALGDRGRLVVRPSGTENLIRVMAEGPDQDELEALAAQISEIIRRELGDPGQ